MCEDAHQKEVQEFLHRWEKIIIPEFENERLLIELETKKRHQNELEELKQTNKYRLSPSLLNLQRQIESLASLGNYTEAKKLNKKFKKLDKIDKNKHEISVSKQMKNKKKALLTQQAKELNAVKDKVTI